jgi:hypothetical protein
MSNYSNSYLLQSTVGFSDSVMMRPIIILLLNLIGPARSVLYQSRVGILDGHGCSFGDTPITFIKCHFKDVASCIAGAPPCTVLTFLPGT